MNIYACIPIASLIVAILLLVNILKEFMPKILIGASVAVICVLFTGIFFAMRYDCKIDMQRFKAYKATILHLRKSEFGKEERFAAINKTTEWNEWLASEQYDNKYIRDFFIPDEINELTPIY